MGKLIVIEGACDGIGKTTQYELLKKRLIEEGNEVVYHHFPSYGTHQAVPVEKYLKGDYGKPSELSPYFINSLYAVDRGITWNIELKKEYENGKTILLDRYTTSSLIYQSALIEDDQERKEFLDYVTEFEYEKIGIKKPDLVIFLYASFDLVTKLRSMRKENEGINNDIHEKDIEFMRKVYNNSLKVAKYFNWGMVKCDNEDSMKDINEIHECVYELVKKM